MSLLNISSNNSTCDSTLSSNFTTLSSDHDLLLRRYDYLENQVSKIIMILDKIEWFYKESSNEENEAEEGRSHSVNKINSLNSELANLEAKLKELFGDINYYEFIRKQELDLYNLYNDIQISCFELSDISDLMTRIDELENIMMPYIEYVTLSDAEKQSSLLTRLDELKKLINDETNDLIGKAGFLKFLYEQSAYEENEAEEGYSHSNESIQFLNNKLDKLEAELNEKYGDIDYYHYIDQTEELKDDLDKLYEHIICLDGLSMIDGNALYNYDIRIKEYEVKITNHIKLLKN